MALKTKTNIPDLVRRTRKLIAVLPRLVANKAKQHYLLGFRLGGKQTDASQSGWAPRKKADKIRGKRAILVRTGQLFGDIDVRSTSLKRIVIGTQSTPYSSFHNEGSGNLPQREFLGHSRKLNRKLQILINREFKKAYE